MSIDNVTTNPVPQRMDPIDAAPTDWRSVVAWTPRAPRPTGTRRERLTSRRSFMRGVVGGAIGIGITSLGVFPPAREALASHDGHKIWTGTTTGPCAPGGYAAGHNCDPICGPSQVCSGCCATSGTYAGFHKSSFPYSWRPNQCFTGGYDGWRWKCGSQPYRCHDGRYTSCSVECQTVKTICRKAV